MLKPPLPITSTLFTSTRSPPPAMAPDARYACALGAFSDVSLTFRAAVDVKVRARSIECAREAEAADVGAEHGRSLGMTVKDVNALVYEANVDSCESGMFRTARRGRAISN